MNEILSLRNLKSFILVHYRLSFIFSLRGKYCFKLSHSSYIALLLNNIILKYAVINFLSVNFNTVTSQITSDGTGMAADKLCTSVDMTERNTKYIN